MTPPSHARSLQRSDPSDHGHDHQAWGNKLYHFAERIFR
jgi:hypothetical protein